MKAIQKPTAVPGFTLINAPIPTYGPDEVLIKVTLASICGTDVHITEWDEWSASRINPPIIYGHEFCGVVEAVGQNVTHVKPGDFVSAEMHIPCDVCYSCRTGKRHICENIRIAGVDRDGCFAEYITLPKNQIIKLPEPITPEYGALLDSLGNAVHAVSKANVSGNSVLILGCGPIGLFSIAVANALGATRVFATDMSEYRLQLAQQMGRVQVFKAGDPELYRQIESTTTHSGIDVVLEMSGSMQAFKTGLDVLNPGGTVVLFGIPQQSASPEILTDIIFKEATVLGVHGREIYSTWLVMLELLASGRLNIDSIITHRIPLSQFGEAISLVKSGNCGKVLLDPTR